jgi:ABC-type metal ion transport system substrate-binding protein
LNDAESYQELDANFFQHAPAQVLDIEHGNVTLELQMERHV